MGPVINEASMKSILGYIDAGKKEGRLVAGGKRAEGDGYFIEPTVIADVDRKARIFQEEIFGPVLAVSKAKDFDDALAMANDTEFGLTGAVYSQNPAKIERAAEEFHVGNLVHEPQMHRRNGGRASIRRLQHVRHRFKIRRPGLPAAIPASKNHRGKRRRHKIARLNMKISFSKVARCRLAIGIFIIAWWLGTASLIGGLQGMGGLWAAVVFAAASALWFWAYILSGNNAGSRSSGGFLVIALWMIHLTGAMLFDFRHYIRDRFFLASVGILLLLVGATALSMPRASHGAVAE